MRFPSSLDSSVSGCISFANARAAGADITEADSRWDAETPKEMYAARALSIST